MSHTFIAASCIQFVMLMAVLDVKEKFPRSNICVRLVRVSNAVKLNPRGIHIV
jgi:hypothetical protein